MNNKLFFILCCMSVFATNVLAAPANNTNNDQDGWIVFIPTGNKTTLNIALSGIQSSSNMKLASIIEDDNLDTFNAIVVHGHEDDIKNNFKNMIVAKNENNFFQGGQSENKEIEYKSNWGLHRISRLGNNDNYIYPTSGGEGVVVYILDTGVDWSHPKFNGRVKPSPSSFANDPEKDNKDSLGHGTHVAGIVGSDEFGVARKVKMISVAMAEPRGFFKTENIVRACQYILNDHLSQGNRSSIVNMSFGGRPNAAKDAAINALSEAGIHIVASAGNNSGDACKSTPSGLPNVLTVAASNIDNKLYQYSNYGNCVDIIAPGEDILSLAPDNKQVLLSGTSMAAPFVTGVLALALSEKKFPNVESAYKYVKSIALENYIMDVPSKTENLFLFNGVTPSCTHDKCSMV